MKKNFEEVIVEKEVVEEVVDTVSAKDWTEWSMQQHSLKEIKDRVFNYGPYSFCVSYLNQFCQVKPEEQEEFILLTAGYINPKSAADKEKNININSSYIIKANDKIEEMRLFLCKSDEEIIETEEEQFKLAEQFAKEEEYNNQLERDKKKVFEKLINSQLMRDQF